MRHRLLGSLLAATCIVSSLGITGCGGGGAPVAAPDPGFSGGVQAAAAEVGSPTLLEPAGDEEAVPGEFIVKYKDGAAAMATRDGVRLFGAVPTEQVAALKAQVVKLPQGAAVPEAEFRSRVEQDPNVEYVEPNYVRRISLTPNDPQFKNQYALTRVSAAAAWDVTLGSEQVTVALIDSGVDMRHPDLKARLVPGRNVLTDTDNVMDDNGHGTHTAGVTAATANNGVGVAGLAGKVKIMPIKAMDGQGRGNDSAIAEGIIWAADHGADVINLSVGGPQAGRTLALAVRYALSRNVVVVAAMGNEGRNQKDYPSAYAGVIAVGATDQQDRIASFSNFGSWISVAAPGVRILSTTPTYPVALSIPMRDRSGRLAWPGLKQNYDYLDGTSMSAPLVAGLAALVRSKYRDLSPAQVKQRIEKGADPSAAGGFDPYYGHGRINAGKALG